VEETDVVVTRRSFEIPRVIGEHDIISIAGLTKPG
jgi:hypothetical protein